MSIWQPPVLYEERLRPSGRAWWWLLVICVVTLFTLSVFVIPIAILAWFVNVGRYARTRIRVDSERIWVGNRSLRLTALDLDEVGRATNPRPWRVFSPRYLGGNPFWTHDSIGVHGTDGTKKCWVSVGTNRRDELVGVLRDAARAANERRAAAIAAYAGRTLPTPGWYDDPWDAGRIRWWDGEQWTGYAAPHPSGRPSTS
ncbi:MAG: DUF3093 family protein [Acidimicrobiia bacterium]|jgi:hypothetical protein